MSRQRQQKLGGAMSTRKRRHRSKSPRRVKEKPADGPSLKKRLETAAQSIFKAESIVACCRLACASLYDSEHSREEMVFALEASVDLLGAAAEEIEAIEDEHCDEDKS